MKIFFLFIISLVSWFALGQNFVDLANVYWRTSPGNKGNTAGETVNFNTYAFDARAPIKLNDKSTLIFGFDIANNSIRNTSANESWIFSSTTLQAGMEHKWTDRFKTLLLLMPKLSTNFTGGVDSRDFQFGGTILNTLKHSDHFDWRFGAYVNGELFSVMIVPLFGFNWKINEAWRLKTVIPVNLELSRIMSKKWIAGLLFIGANASYRLRQQLNPDTTYPNSYQPYLDKADNNAWLYSDIYLTKNIVLNLKAGHSVLRKYRIYDEDDKLGLKLGPVNIGDDRADAPVLMKNGWSFETRLIFRMPL
jgi:hypothetical protein